jgi:hypothetical protein
MKRALALLAAVVIGATPVGVVYAQDAVQKAASEFDEGKRHYRDGRFESAAEHFEAADAAVPSPRALRMAMRCRDQAGHKARAATLAAQALARYPDDRETRELANPILAKHAPGLHRLDVSCTKPCSVALGAEVVPGVARDSWVVYVDPGEVTVSASFAGGAGAEEQVLNARAGGKNALSFMPRPKAGAPAAAPAHAPVPDGPDEPPPPVDERSWIEHPAVFGVLAGGTAVLGGVTIWSGIDTLNNPGADKVREECRGQGTDCPEYKEGRQKQLRTNILIGATAGLAATTLLIGVLVTEWTEPAPAAAFSPLPGGGIVELGGKF